MTNEMNLKARILKLLNESDDITVTSTKDGLNDTLSDVKDAMSKDSTLKGSVDVAVMDEGLGDFTAPSDIESQESDYQEFRNASNEMASDDIRRFYNKNVSRKSDGLVGNVVRWDNGVLKIEVISGKFKGRYFSAEPSEVEILPDSPMTEVIGRMSKGKLEKLVEQSKVSKGKILKVKDIKAKNG
jgi:hypothetical protein